MFSQPPDPDSFHTLVWEIVQQIPEGRVAAYGQIGAMIPPPPGVEPAEYDRLRARWVGRAMNAVPSGSGVPWHRVINSQGTISLPAGSAAAEEQRARLEMEGVRFDERGRVDFGQVGWDGPPADWLEARGLLPAPPLARGPAQDDSGPDAAQLSLF